MSPLTRSTQIPTSLRGKIRALVKAHPDWKAYLIEKDLISARAKNADLIDFALRYQQAQDLTAQIEQMLQTHAAAVPKESAAVLMLVNRIEKLLAAYAAKKLRSLTEGDRRSLKVPHVRIKATVQAL